jgi:hypothetical protein
MSRLSVHARKIRNLTLTKQHIASIAWELDLYAMQNLSASSYRVWHFIRALAAFDTQSYSAKISQEFIASKLGCSVKTINRAISEINKTSLIEIKHNTSIKTGTGVNTYFIIFPEDAYKQAEAKSNKTVTTPLPSMKVNIEATKQAQKEQPEPIVFEKNATNRATHKQPKTDVYPPYKSDVHNSEYYFSEKNNKTVVVNFSDKNKIITLENKEKQLTTLLTKLDQQKQTLQEQLSKLTQTTSTDSRLLLLKRALNNTQEIKTSKTRERSKSLLKQINQLDLKKEQIKKEYEQLTKKIKQSQKTKALTKDPAYINKLEGERQFTDQDLKFVLTKLNKLDLSVEKRNQLANEVIFETRFGSLAKNNETQQKNPIKRSINIGCKLIRAGQWSTPTKFNDIYQ